MKSLRAILILILMTVFATALASADDAAPVEIRTPEELIAIADNPEGNYVLMNDLDLTGYDWPSFTFKGTFDGNGHTIINIHWTKVSDETQVTYDGNRKTYDTHFAGFFAILDHATVKNVRLPGVDLFVENYEGDCFLGGIAGYATESTIENCEVSGTIRLDVTGKMFGVGGIIGYGNGVIKNCKAEVTLVNIDLDAKNRDEEFLGGVCAAGYPDIDGCEIQISGFLSDHGYVHSGGLVGMYIVYPKAFKRDGYIKNNKLTGFITFFEDNTNRRAYCKESYGEVMDWYFTTAGDSNKYSFKRDERKKYDVNLLPHGECKNPDFEETKVEATCQNPGYTLHTCKTCGYTEKDNYVLSAHHFPETYETITESTLTTQGVGEYTCSECGAKIRKALPTLTPVPTAIPVPTTEPTEAPSKATTDTINESKSGSGVWPYLLIFFIGIPLGVIAALLYRRHRIKKLKRLRKARRAQAARAARLHKESDD